jgi:hypothetical protein
LLARPMTAADLERRFLRAVAEREEPLMRAALQ